MLSGEQNDVDPSNRDRILQFARALLLLITFCLSAGPALACRGGSSPRNTALESLMERVNASPQHILSGGLYDVGNKFFEDKYHPICARWPWENLRGLFDGKSIVVLGEVHDNSIHHELRAYILGHAARSDTRKPIIFEQLRTDRQPALDAFAELQTKSPDQATLPEFKRLTDWDKSGWQQYNYDPLLQEALVSNLPLYAGDVPRAAMMKVAKDGEGALPADERARLKLDVPLGPKLDDASLTELVESHCNTMPKEAMGGMAYAQRYRDATLADTVLKAAEKHGSAILIAGNGHVRTDRGVPWYIRQRAPGKKVVSVMLVEVEDGKTDPEAYVPRDPNGQPAADYIIFTPRAERQDPCEKMREKMGK